MSSSASITSLLNSLHSHLQSQTQLLPTLHAQLGLPPTALADELSTLQQTLTQCVEDQIDGRQKQVNEWMAKCEEVEEECQRYAAALGGNVKSAGSTVGELRKEHILPRRYELVSELQEKLRQLYHTKLEQLTTLTNRIAVLARTLGEGYFASDILDPKHAGNSNAAIPSSHRDVTPERFSKLEKELVRGKGEVGKRLQHLSSIFVQVDWLYTELGIIPPSIDDLPGPSSSSLTVPYLLPRPSSSFSSSNSSADPFLASTSTPTPGSRTTLFTPALLLSTAEPDAEATEQAYQRIFAHFAARLDEVDDEALLDGRTAGLEGVEPTPGLLAWADGLRGELEDTKRRREAHIQAMYDQLEGLWRRLGVPDADMDAFVDANRGSTEDTVRMYEEELERMLELKRERMGTFVENARAEIARLWEELMIGEEERQDFAPYFDDEHTEELLVIHEDEIKRLKEERRMKAHLLGSIRKYFDICEEEKELAAAASDQSRLLGRGPRDPGRLLREEKMRKRVQKEKPRLEQDLLASIPAWEAEADRPFLVHGESMLQILQDAVQIWGDKENKRRAGSVPPRSRTPSNSNSNTTSNSNAAAHPYTGGKGVVTPAVRPSSSMAGSQSAPNKRPRLGDANGAQRPGFARSTSGTKSVGAGAARRAPSPSKIAAPVPLKMPASSLPRPTQGQQHATLGLGRVPSTGYRQTRSVSSSASASASASVAAYGHAALSRSTGVGVNPHAAARKASRARRESFKPRPSVDAPWPVGGKYAGFAGGVKEEEYEDY